MTTPTTLQLMAERADALLDQAAQHIALDRNHDAAQKLADEAQALIEPWLLQATETSMIQRAIAARIRRKAREQATRITLAATRAREARRA